MKRLVVLLLWLVSYTSWGQPATSNVTSDVLTDEQVQAFQQSAIQKLQDFYDFLDVASSQAYEKQLRDDAKLRARQSFYETDCTIDGKLVKSYIDSCAKLQNRLTLKAFNVKVKEPMKQAANVLDNTYYQGMLSFTLSSDKGAAEEKEAYIILARNTRQTGRGKKEVWAVFICEIK